MLKIYRLSQNIVLIVQRLGAETSCSKYRCLTAHYCLHYVIIASTLLLLEHALPWFCCTLHGYNLPVGMCVLYI